MISKQTQCQKVLEYLKRFGSITSMEAFNELSCTRLASRIHDLRDSGYAITGRMETRKNKFGDAVSYKRYFMNQEEGGSNKCM